MIAHAKKSALATLVFSLLAFAVGAAPASAEIVNSYTSQFNGSETPAGSFVPHSVAAAPDGGVWVSDSANGVVDKFDAEGKYVSQVKAGGSGIAVDASGNLYLASGEFVKKYSPAGAFITEFKVGGVVALDIDDAGNLYITGGGDGVAKFDPTGTLVFFFDGSHTPIGGLQAAQVAVDSAGYIYVYDRTFAVTFKFSPAGEFVETVRYQSVGGFAAAPNGDLYASSGGLNVFHYDPDGFLFSEFDGSATPQGFMIAGALSVGPGGGVYVADEIQGYVSYFGPRTVLDVVTDDASNIAGGSLTFNGSVNPQGTGLSECKFEYGLSASYDKSVPCAETPAQIGSGSSPVSVHADLSGFAPGNYHLRLVAANATDSGRGHDIVAPVVAVPVFSNFESEPTNTEAELRVAVNPSNAASNVYVEYGLTEAYGQKKTTDVVPAGTEDVTTGFVLTGLTAGAVYHFRVVGENSAGKAVSDDHVFVAPNFPGVGDNCPNAAIRDVQKSAFLAECRAYEQISPAVKNGAGVDLLFNPPFIGDNGDAIAYSTEKAAYPGADSTPFSPRSLSLRTATGWSTRGIDPPMDSVATTSLQFYATIALSRDLSRALVTTNAKLTPDAPATGGTYVRQVGTTSYAYVGPFDLSSAGAGADFIGASDDLSTVVIGNAVWRQGAGTEAVALKTGGAPFPTPTATADPDLVDAHQVSADGSRIYFAVSGAGEEGLYLRNGNTTTLVSRADSAPSAPVPATFSSASADGRYVIFETGGEAQLTADAVASPGANQAYRYDTQTGTMTFLASGLAAGGGVLWADAESGDLFYSTDSAVFYAALGTAPKPVAATAAAQSGPDAIQVSDNGKYAAVGSVFYDVDANASKTFAGAHLGQSVEAGASHHRPRAILDDGTYFFDTPARLVSTDVNATRDIYRYNHGQVSLLTSAKQSVDAQLLGVTADGRDVFFSTIDSLVGQDDDTARDVYDARVGGGIAAQNPPDRVECLRDDCKATPNRGPELPFGGSEGLVDSENVAPKRCPKGRHLKKSRGKSRCVVKQHKKQKRAKNNRRQAR